MRGLQLIIDKKLRERSIVLDEYVYRNIKDEYKDTNLDIDNILNGILYEWYENLIKKREKEEKLREELKNQEEELIKNYIVLDKYLYSSIDEEVLISLTGYGRRKQTCVLVDYELHKVGKFIKFKLSYKEEEFEVVILNPNCIELRKYDDIVRVRIWNDDIMREIELHYKEDKFNSIDNGFKSSKMTLVNEEPYYEKYRANNPLKYNIERLKSKYNLKYFDKKFIKDSSGREYCLVLSYDENNKCGYNRTCGEMYCINANEVNGVDYWGKMDFDLIDKNEYIKSSKEVAEIVNLDVYLQSKTIGSQMIKYFEDFMRVKGVYILKGEMMGKPTRKEQERLRKFYNDNGFETFNMMFRKELNK